LITEIDILQAVYIAIPAYIANAFPTLFGGGPPMDLGFKFIDDKRIFGANKTFRGFGMALILGILAAIAEEIFLGPGILLIGVLAALGALLGDLLGSFIKRRINFKPGKPFPILDQLDFILGALILTYPVQQVGFGTIIILIVFTPPVHLLANFFAYHLGVKKNWW
jgi:CDP-2,3-bis-(O-geranylgeranyl)-sn-glycerol synthase